MIFPLPPTVGRQAARTSRLCPTLPGTLFSTKTTLSPSSSIIPRRFASTYSGSSRQALQPPHHRRTTITSSPTTTTIATITGTPTNLFRSQQTQSPPPSLRLSQPSQLYHSAEPLSPAIFSRHAYRNYNSNRRQHQFTPSSYLLANSNGNTITTTNNAVGSPTPLALLSLRQQPRSGRQRNPTFGLTGSGPRRRAFVPCYSTTTCSSGSLHIRVRERRAFHSSSSDQYSQPYYAMKNSQGDTLRVHLEKYRDIVGLRSTRCQRKYNQDRYKVLVLDAPQLETGPTTTTTTIASTTTTSSSTRAISQMDADQKILFYFAIFDGHGGSNTADHLTANLDVYIEAAKPDMVPKVIKDLRKLGGYFRNFRPHFLEPFLAADFETKGSRDAADRARQQRRVHIPGKGGQVKPMIFIPHPNATEEEQEQELESLENQATAAGTTVKGATPTRMEVPLSEEQRKQKERAATNKPRIEMLQEDEEEDEYDEDDDPFVIARRRNLNRTSPLPGGTTAYFGTDRSEYASLSLRAEDLAEKEKRKQAATATPTPIPTTMTLEQRLCLSFLQCDAELVRDKYRDGSTASVVIVQSKGAFWETKDDLDLILAHVGDTRILLCEAPRGESIQLTTDHHPDAIVEAERIRKMAAYVSADSFGENMFLGQLANTRALGDIAMKPFGVSAEPELIRRTVKASEAAFLVLISDGISSVMSNQEVVDCIKLEENPTQAAANVLNLAEQLGAEDNCTIMVVKLPAWGTKMPDLSKELREYRWQSEAQQSKARRR